MMLEEEEPPSHHLASRHIVRKGTRQLGVEENMGEKGSSEGEGGSIYDVQYVHSPRGALKTEEE
jgi:hypothetical protein